jgi:hypothetical protein
MRAKKAGDQNTSARSQTGKKTDEQKDHRSGTGDCRKGIVPGEIADYPGIFNIIKLLQELSEKERKCKSNDVPDNRSFGQIQRAVTF